MQGYGTKVRFCLGDTYLIRNFRAATEMGERWTAFICRVRTRVDVTAGHKGSCCLSRVKDIKSKEFLVHQGAILYQSAI